jgi:hypothetical protein
MSINNDKDFKVALAGLLLAHQRKMAVSFTRRVMDLCYDARIKGVLLAAERADITEPELLLAEHAAHQVRVRSFGECSHDTSWSLQAGHFVATAAKFCVSVPAAGENIAWNAAMQARLARTCQEAADGDGIINAESTAQYELLESFLSAEGKTL